MGNAVRLAPKISKTVIGKLSLGARILQNGGVENVYRQIFRVGEREKLLKACQCYLSTTAGPIAGLLFISTEKIAFCSERSLAFTTPGGSIRTPYKVIIKSKKLSIHKLSSFYYFFGVILIFFHKLNTKRNIR